MINGFFSGYNSLIGVEEAGNRLSSHEPFKVDGSIIDCAFLGLEQLPITRKTMLDIRDRYFIACILITVLK